MVFDALYPLLRHIDSETAHHAALKALGYAGSSGIGRAVLGLANYKGSRFDDPRLETTLGTVKHPNPLRVGAGWDKVGLTVDAWCALGCAGVVVGTVTQFPQEGNSRPRQFAVGGVVLNRLGFPGPGMNVVADNLARTRVYPGAEQAYVGVSVGRNKDVSDMNAPAAYAAVVHRLYDSASDFELNVSSPNTEGLRRLQESGPLTDIVRAVNQTMDAHGGRKPVTVKIAPDDMGDAALDAVIRVVQDEKATGIVAANTTVDEALKAKYGWERQKGGLSGDDPEYRRRTTELIGRIYERTDGTMSIIGVGGINSAAAAIEKMEEGAAAVQIVSGIRQEGWALPGIITRGIAEHMDSKGMTSMTELIGSAHRRLQRVPVRSTRG